MNQDKLAKLKARYHSGKRPNPWPDRIALWIILASTFFAFIVAWQP